MNEFGFKGLKMKISGGMIKKKVVKKFSEFPFVIGGGINYRGI